MNAPIKTSETKNTIRERAIVSGEMSIIASWEIYFSKTKSPDEKSATKRRRGGTAIKTPFAI